MSYTSSDFVNRLVKKWIDSTSLSDRSKRILSNVNNIANMRQEDILPYVKGIATGFFVDGFWGSLSGIEDLGSLLGRGLIQANPLLAYLYSRKYGEQPLAPEGRAIVGAAKKIGGASFDALPAIQAFAEEFASGGSWLSLMPFVSANNERLKKYSQLAQDIGEFARNILLDVIEAAFDRGRRAETRGRIVGFVLYQIVEGLATAGTAPDTPKSEAACNVARHAHEVGSAQGLSQGRRRLYQKSVDLITHVLQINICFVANTSIFTPRGVVPIEAIRARRRGLDSPLMAAAIERMSSAASRKLWSRIRSKCSAWNCKRLRAWRRCAARWGIPSFRLARKDSSTPKTWPSEIVFCWPKVAADDHETYARRGATQRCFTTYNFAVRRIPHLLCRAGRGVDAQCGRRSQYPPTFQRLSPRIP